MNTIPAKVIITKKKDTSWFGTDYNMNIYKGCCHGCIYCDSRSDCYQITDFDLVRMKENALQTIENELRKKTKTGVIGTGAMSDPYNPYEQTYQLTRKALELIDTYHFGAAIATKSALITRDIDLLQRISKHSPVLCKITITTHNDLLSRKIEPGVSESSKRLEAVRLLSEAGLFTGILMMPLLPGITDTPDNVRDILHAAHDSGAKFVYPFFGLTLRAGQREYFYEKLEQLFPDQNLKQFYINHYGAAYECHSLKAKELWHIFLKECKELGILYHMEEIIQAYKRNYDYQQLTLF